MSSALTFNANALDEAINSRLAEASYAEQYFLQWWK